MSNASTPSSSNSAAHVPRVGGVRCYWALVTPKFPVPGMHESKLALKFVHPDPVLGAHLARQQMTMVGRDMLDFIHPSERHQARVDLAGAISTNDLQGSVTRVRFARLSRIREILGGTKDEIEYPSDAQTFVEDDEYLILDLVLNWVADGLLLAFFHAIRDKDPVGNNDPSKRNEEWTNFCGTANMPEDQIEALNANLHHTLNPTPQTNYPPTRVFQLHTTPTSPTRPDQLVFSWPPPRQPSDPGQYDGRYDAAEYADLMKGVDMDPSALQTPAETKTNCTTRFGATHSLTSEGVYRVVSSVFIPYGNLIFACFQTIKLVDPSASRSPSTRHDSVITPPKAEWPSPSNHEEMYRTPERRAEMTEYQTTQQSQLHASNGHSHGHGGDPHSQNRIHGYSHPHPPDEYEYEYDRSYPPPPPQTQPRPQPPSLHASPYVPHTSHPHPSHASHSAYPPQPIYHEPPPVPVHHSSTYPPPPPPPQHHHMAAPPYLTDHQNPSPPSASSRPLIPPPSGVEACVICGTTESPEWRRNESGIKDLCNACGLRLARQVAKREGRQKPRKKKDRP